MADYDFKNDPKVIVIKSTNYRGMTSRLNDGGGWKIVLDNEEYLFPNWQDAKFAIDRIHEDLVTKYGGEKLTKKT